MEKDHNGFVTRKVLNGDEVVGMAGVAEPEQPSEDLHELTETALSSRRRQRLRQAGNHQRVGISARAFRGGGRE